MIGVASSVMIPVTASVMYAQYETHRVLADALPLALAMFGGAAMAMAGWYGNVLMRLFRLRHTIDRYTPHHGLVTPRAPHPRPVPTIG